MFKDTVTYMRAPSMASFFRHVRIKFSTKLIKSMHGKRQGENLESFKFKSHLVCFPFVFCAQKKSYEAYFNFFNYYYRREILPYG